jgi:hypothetical protein
MLRRTFLAVAAVLAMATVANAGAMYAYLVIDPATTAGAAIAPIVNPGGGTMAVTSTRSGANTWHLYAVDDIDNSFGIKTYNIKLNGTLPAINNRSASGTWTDGNDTFNEGFSDAVVRTGSNVNPIAGSQATPSVANTPLIGGYGINASNFVLKTPGGATNSYSPVANGQWGLYADPLTSGIVAATGHVRNSIFLAEGTYTGAAPTIDTATLVSAGGSVIAYYNQDPATVGSPGGTNAPSLVTTNPFIPEPATMTLVGLALVGFSGLVGRRRS